MLFTRTRRCVAFVALVGLMSASFAMAQGQAQPGQSRRGGDGGQGGGGQGGRGGFGGGFAGGFGGGGAMALLGRDDVKEELELADEQVAKLTKVQESAQAKMREMFANRGGGGGSGGAGGGDPREMFRKFADEQQAEVNKVLLPHQAKRLKQLEMQMRMRGGLSGIFGREVAEQVGISEGDQEKLREKARELETELRKKTAEIRKQLQDQLIASMSAEQQAKIKDLVGEPFEFKDDGGPGGFGFGGPGGPGGFGGGGAGGPGGGRRGGDRPQRPEQEKDKN